MKICFVLQRRFAYIGHALAQNIAEAEPGASFCAFVQTRKSLAFLKNQTDIRYSALLLEEDIHRKLYKTTLDEAYLANFEKEYGIPNLWPYLYVDRVVMHEQLIREYPHNRPLLSLHNMKRLMQVTAQEVTAFLDREQPDVIVGSVFGSVGTLLLYTMAKKRGIRTLNLDIARIKNRVAFSDDIRTFTSARNRFEELRLGAVSPAANEARAFLEEFRAAPAPYHEQASPTFNKQAFKLSNLRFLAPQRLIRSIPWYTKRIMEDVRRMGNRDYTDIVTWLAIWDMMKRKARGLYGASDLTRDPDWNTQFAYFPLHYEPEIATMLFAPYYTNQLEVIRAAAHALPFGILLYVKDHPAMVGYRKRSYYKEITQIPNVRLVPAHIPGHEFSRHAAITITITGTGGWETLLFGRPVITFGDVFYNDVPGALRCRGFEELPSLIKTQLENYRCDDRTLIAYLSALFEESVAVDYIDMWTKADSLDALATDPGITKLTGALMRALKLKTI